MDVPMLAGFADPVHGSQAVFRALLDALSFPGRPRTFRALPAGPRGLGPACAAACLTLLDAETPVFLQPGTSPAVQTWLRFHTGCRLVAEPRAAGFALLDGDSPGPTLSLFDAGTAERPEDAATLLVQVRSFTSGQEYTLSGPGIRGPVRLRVDGLRPGFWDERSAAVALYPKGVDVFLFTRDEVVGLPRTTRGERS